LTHEIALVLAVLVIAIILFAAEKLRVDVISMMVLLSLLLLGLVDIDEAFSGFSSPAVITVWAIYIVSAGLFRTGVADFIGQRILSVAGSSEPRLIGVIMLAGPRQYSCRRSAASPAASRHLPQSCLYLSPLAPC
jgi:di/tricarboxylate transporter